MHCKRHNGQVVGGKGKGLGEGCMGQGKMEKVSLERVRVKGRDARDKAQVQVVGGAKG
jgi:hypothetical protein